MSPPAVRSRPRHPTLARSRRAADTRCRSKSTAQARSPVSADSESEVMAKPVKARREDRDYEDLVRLYLEDVGRHNLLTKDDEIRLAQAIEGGVAARAQLETAKKLTPTQRRQLRRAIRQGEEGHRQFVNSNLRLGVSIAKKYQSSGLPLLDIVQEGNL